MKYKITFLLFFLFVIKSSAQPVITAQVLINGDTKISTGYFGGGTWEIEYGPSGFVLGTGTVVSCGSAYFKTLKLNPFVNWDFRSRSTYFSSTTPWSQVTTLNNTNCAATPKTVGYSFNFDSNPINDCWRGYQVIEYYDGYAGTADVDATRYHGTSGSSLRLSSYYKSGILIVSPKITDLATDKKIKLWLSRESGGGALSIGTIANPYDKTTYHELGTVTTSYSTSFSEKTVFFNNYNGTDQYIAIKYLEPYGSSGSLFIDDFSYEQSVNCFDASNFSVSDITEHSAQVNFNDSGQTAWELSVKNMLTSQEQIIPITGSPYVLTNLTGNTNYQVKVRANCDVGLYSNWTPLTSFTTTCANMTAGYYTGFDESSYLNPCWSKILSNSYYDVQLTTSSTSITAASGNKYLNFNGTSTYYNYTTMLVTPYAADLNNNKRIRFKIYDNKRSDFLEYPFIIGTLSNPTDASTFVPLVTLDPHVVNPIGMYELGSFWQQYIIDLTNYNLPANSHYIAFKIGNFASAGSFSQNVLFDDFYYEEIPVCKEPTNLQVVNYDYDRATVSWTNPTGISAWQIEYGPTGFTSGTGTIIDAGSSPFTLTNLQAGTSFDYYVRSVCSGTPGNWSCKGYFKTRCDGVTIGYNTSFENESFDANTTCWRRVTPSLRNNSYSPSYFINSYTNGQFGSQNSHTGTKLIAMRGGADSPDTNEQNKTILVTPRLLDFDNTRQLSFWIYCPNDAYSTLQGIVIGTMSNPNDYNSFVAYQTFTSPYTLNQWRKYTVDFSGYTGTNRYIGIKTISSNGNHYVFLDDFEYFENPCRKPTNLMASQASATSTTLSWNANITTDLSTTWQIEYGEMGITPGTGTLLTVTTNPFVLNGLEAQKKYQFRVRNVCSNNFTNWSDWYTFKISCAFTTPFYENFDQYQTVQGFSSMDPNSCWTSNNPSYAGVVQFSLNNINSAPNSAQVESSGVNTYPPSGLQGTLISPYLSDFDNTKRVKFWAYFPDGYSVNTMNLIVGTVKNPLDLSTFVPYKTIQMDPQNHSGTEYIVDFSNYTGDSKFFAFKSDGFNEQYFLSNRIYIDDVHYEVIPTCLEPVNIHPEYVTGNTTHFLWQNAPGETVTVEYGPEGFVPGTGIVLTSNTMDVMVNGLLPSTNYDFYFTASCGSSTSSVIGPKKISTTCLPEPLPWYEDFNGLNTYGLNVLPACFKDNSYDDFYLYNFSVDSYSNANANSGGYNYDNLITGYNDTTYLRFRESFLSGIYTPVFHLNAGVTYKFSLQARKSYEYDFSTIDVRPVRGQEYYFRDAELHREGTLTEYNYEKNSFYYTPIESSDYSFNVVFRDSGGIDLIVDDFKVEEGYDQVVDSYGRLDPTQNNSGIVLEKTETNDIALVTEEGQSALKMTGSSNTDFLGGTSLWQNNQNYVSKVNFKVNSSGLGSLYLRFDLKQLYNQNSNDSGFRVLINGIAISDVLYPSQSIQNGFQSFEFNLASYIGTNIYVSLQHIGKTTTDVAYLRNIELTQTSTLSLNDIENISIKAYPNPTNHILNIESSMIIDKIQISSVSGQIINTVDVNGSEAKVDMSQFSKGVYFLNISCGGQNKILKVLKI